MSITPLGSRNPSVTGNNLTHSLFNFTNAITVGDLLVLGLMGYKRSGGATVQAGVPATVGSAEVWTEVANQLVTSDAEDMLWIGVYTSTALAGYAAGNFEVDTTFPVATRFGGALIKHSETSTQQDSLSLHNGAEPWTSSFDSAPAFATSKFIFSGARKVLSGETEVDWPTPSGFSSGEGSGGNYNYSWAWYYWDGDVSETDFTWDWGAFVTEVDQAVYMAEYGAGPPAAAGVKVLETKLHLKQLPNKVYAASLDGWA